MARVSELPSRNRLAARLICEIARAADQFERAGFEPFKRGWLQRDVHYNKRVEIGSGAWRKSGRHVGISPLGGLLLATDGGIEELVGGEISLRPVQQNDIAD